MASPGGASNRSNTYNFKLVLLGEGAVGKTSVVLSYVEGKFNEKHTTTLQASFLTKKLSLGGRRVTLAIWDTAGQERFHALGPIYYRDSNGACLVYDVTDEDSFQKVKNWVKELRKMLGSEICLVICGNKVDLTKDRVVDLNTALAYSDSVAAKHFETSAKTGVGIEEVFLFLSQQMVRVKDSRDAAAAGSGSGSLRRRQNVVVVEQPEPEPAKRSCCG